MKCLCVVLILIFISKLARDDRFGLDIFATGLSVLLFFATCILLLAYDKIGSLLLYTYDARFIFNISSTFFSGLNYVLIVLKV